MPARQIIVLSLCIALVGCGESKLNPMNWFGGSQPRETIVLPETPADPRPLVAEVVSLKVEPMPGGAIVRATGRTPTQGWWKAELIPLPLTEDGTLVYEFRLVPPPAPTSVSTPQSREVTVAEFISDIRLEPVREIVVQGSGNARSARR
ncbi:hypothetical protein [Tabrizicola sp. BL-A-41-H6]|uniref:hypothetical protein n=1 Tax=Tabrizicola sp. BL-A-41-H6 TaxID=3421107 RepID=UPI003D666371